MSELCFLWLLPKAAQTSTELIEYWPDNPLLHYEMVCVCVCVWVDFTF